MGINKTHWTGQEKMQLAEGETIIYSGRNDDNHREGVGILMSKHVTRSLIEWTPISERATQARLYSRYIKLIIIHIYAPTEDADEQMKDEFYGRLQDVIDSVNEHGMLIVTGDMNAKVGNDNWVYESVMGKHGLRQRNDNGERLCDICDTNELGLTGTLFPHKTIHKATWVSPSGNTINKIYHVRISRRFRNSVKDTRVYRSADIGSENHL
ncbi:craniofacial development protein 2-like, partial [Stylophora pistillata]|uniref:craniofacial development protein 2-like n=1 Tax=Stylophora pistillata TaxID=50429 RepID=UPI000C04CD93